MDYCDKKHFELPRKMVKFAEDFIGNVGEYTLSTYSTTGERYVEYVHQCKNTDDIILVWEKWVRAYATFAKNYFKGKISYNSNSLTLHWRIKPDFSYYNNNVQVYARLLISTKPQLSEEDLALNKYLKKNPIEM